MQENISFERVSVSHLSDISKLHMISLNEGILAKFGVKFLMAMYRSIILSDVNFGFVALYDQRVVGFAIGMLEHVSLIKCLNIFSILTLIKNSMFSPHVIFLPILLRKRIYKSEVWSPEVEISQIAVSEKFRGSGIGSKLVELIEAQSAKLGIVDITTRTHNEKFVSFYIREKGAKIRDKVTLANNQYFTLQWKVKVTSTH